MELANLNVKDFYNGRSLLDILDNENIIAYYIYDRDKKAVDEKYREIAFFLTDTHLIKSTARHQDILIEKWDREDFKKIEKHYAVKIFNREKYTEIEELVIVTSVDKIPVLSPVEITAGDEIDNYRNFIKYF